MEGSKLACKWFFFTILEAFMTKICKRCLEEKLKTAFSRKISSKDLLRNICRSCDADAHAKYHKLNKKNENKRMAHYQKSRSKVDENYNWRLKIRTYTKKAYNHGKNCKYLGCNAAQFKLYLDMSINLEHFNFDEKLVVDHIIPLSKFDLTVEEDRYTAAHFSNCRLIPWSVNSKKGSK
jgi:hypothetical protein